MRPGTNFARFAGLLLLGALSLGVHAETPAQGHDPAVIALQLEPPVLGPTANPAAPIGEVVYGSLFEGLVRLAADGTPQPLLAQSWEVAADGLSYRFQLRQGVRFQDGQPFNAASARFSLERALAGDSLNPYKTALAAIDSVGAPSADSLLITLKRRNSGLLQTLGMAALVMVSPASAADNASHPVGTGPFAFAGWRRGERIDLLRNDDYWGGPARLDGISFRFIADPSAAFSALMAGDIDAFPNYPAPENIAQFQADPGFQVKVGNTSGKTLLVLNNRKPPLDRVEVRRAITQALDRSAIIDGAMYGYGEPIGSHFNPQDRAYLDLTRRYPHDPGELRRVLGDAAQPLTLKLPPPPYARRAGEIVAAQLRAAGLDVRLENLEWAQWLTQVFTDHDFDMSLIVHAEPLDYPIYGRDDYYFGYHSAAYQALLGQLDDSLDERQRDGILQQLQQTLADDAVNAWLFAYPRLSVWSTRLQGIDSSTGLLGNFRLERAWLERSAGNAEASPQRLFAGLAWFALLLPAALLLLALRRFGPLYLLRRLAVLGVTLLAASATIFAILQGVPGDPARYMLGLQAEAGAVEQLRQQLGLDGAPLERYLHWLGALLRGDFGISYTYRVAVGELIGDRLQVSLPLALYALALALLIAFPVGLLAAARRNGPTDLLLSGATQLGVAIPGFWFGMLLVLLFAIKLRWVSAGGFPGWEGGTWAALKALTLPALALALPQAAVLARVLRGALIEAGQEDYMRTARAKGYGRLGALYRHALPNALIPLLTILGMQFSFLLAGAVIIENVFFLPGLGRLVFQAISQRDLVVVQSVVVLLVFAVVLVSFLVEMAYALADPRLQRSRSR